jgi:hypothetical protein
MLNMFFARKVAAASALLLQVAHQPGSQAAVARGGAESHLRPRQAPGLPGSEYQQL